MKNGIKRFLCVAVSVLMISSFFAGCKKSTPSSNSLSSDSTKKVSLSVTWWGNDARNAKFNSILDIYQHLHPNVTLVRAYASGDYFTRLAVQAAGNTLPDIFLMESMHKGTYVANKTMTDLKPYVDNGELDLKNFAKSAIDSGRGSTDKVLYAVPLGTTILALTYNATLIKKAGMEPPKARMTLAQYKDYLVALQAKLPAGYYAGEMDEQTPNVSAVFETQMRQQGMELTSADGKSIGYTKEALTTYYSYWMDLIKAGCVQSPAVFASDSGKSYNEKAAGQGKIGCWFGNANAMKIFQQSIKDEMGMVPGFVVENAKYASCEAPQPSMWAIWSKSQNKDAAARVISWFVNDQAAQSIFDMELGVPGSTVIDKMLIDTLKTDTVLVDRSKQIEINIINTMLPTLQPYPGRTTNAPALNADNDKKFQEVMYGRMTIQQAVDAHFAAAPSILQ